MKIQSGSLLTGIILLAVVLVMSDNRVYAGPPVPVKSSSLITPCTVDMTAPDLIIDSAYNLSTDNSIVLVEDGGEVNLTGDGNIIAVKAGGWVGSPSSSGNKIYLDSKEAVFSDATILSWGMVSDTTIYKELGSDKIGSNFTNNSSNTVKNCPKVTIKE